MENTNIEWCDHTFNPWWGCVKVSAGCAHCYAETQSNRYGKALWGKDADRQIASGNYWKQPIKWNCEARDSGIRRRVFCASMADIFEDRADLIEPRARIFRLIAETPDLDWLLLTKRPENLQHMIPWVASSDKPWPNVWLGTSAENQETFDQRVPHLLRVKAAVWFVSCEPLLGAIDAMHSFESDYDRAARDRYVIGNESRTKLDWIIVGGESGAGARMMHPEWASDIIDQCRGAGVPVFMKQTGTALARRFGLRDKKGGEISEWPSWMQVRQWPAPPGRSASSAAVAWACGTGSGGG